jgi:phenylpropionate dioxygenase-like ring-hydroxylating dioxygenase large terminal subunit
MDMHQNKFPTRAWYSAGWSHEFSRAKPLKRRIVGHEIVFFRNLEGRIVALDAMCPHRGADLSIGIVVNGNIQCPFHGWRFDGQGRCVAIPSQCPSKKIPSKAVVRSYHVQESQGIIWIWPDELLPPEDARPPYYDFLEPDYGLGMRRVRDIPIFAAAPFVSVVENAIDNTHPPFIHPGTLAGEPQRVVAQNIQFDEDMRGYWGQLDPSDKIHDDVKGTDGLLGFSRRLLGVTRLDREKCYFRFDLGGVVYFYDRFVSGHEQVALFMVTPADDTHSWFFGEHVRSFAKNALVDHVIKKWARQLNGEDVNHVELMLSSKQANGIHSPVSVVADTPALAFRRVFFKNLSSSVSSPHPAAAESLRLLEDWSDGEVPEARVAAPQV